MGPHCVLSTPAVRAGMYLSSLTTFLLLIQLTVATPSIHWRSPHVGSVAGGTVLTLSGGGFATDAYTTSNIVWLEGDDGIRILCDVISYTATPYRIECRTRPYPNAKEGHSYPPLRIAIITGSEYYTSTLTFTYSWYYTVPIELVTPRAGPVGSLIEIASNLLPNPPYTYDRLYLGDLQCDHIDNETSRPYSVRWYWSKRRVQCAVENSVVGVYNASVQMRDWANSRGRSWNGSEAMYLMYDGSLAMYELYPDIHSVSPHDGSTLGGTLLTVTGSGFGTNEWDIEVDVDGIPCQVTSHNATHIQCWTGRPHDDDLSIADADGSYSVTESGHRFRGSRGVSVKSYYGSITSLLTLRSQGLYPDNPSRHSTYPSFSSEDNSRRNNYGQRLEAFFNPQTTGNHSFFVAADDQAEVMFGIGTNISDLTTIAHVHSTVGWEDYYRHRGDQRSEVMELWREEDYLLVTEFAESGGADYVNVAVLMHETQYTHSQTQQANRERQLIQLSTIGLYEIQALRVVINTSAESSASDGWSEEDGMVRGLELEWNGDRHAVVTASDLLNNPNGSVADALLSLSWGQCSYYTEHGVFHIEFWNNAVYGFEDSQSHSEDITLWQAWNGNVPVVVRNEALCGRSSLYLPEGRGLVFDLEANSNLAIELEDVPYYMCFAYKLPRNHAFSLVLRLRGVQQWLSAYFIHDVVTLATTSMGSLANLYSGTDIRDDNQWHYMCIDLQAIISNGFFLPDYYEYTGVHFLEGFGFYADADPQLKGFYLDEVSFSHNARNLNTTAYIPPSHPNGIIIETITATNTSVAMDDGLVAMTITLEFNPLNCGHDFTLFSARLTSPTHPAVLEVAVERVQRASQPLGGHFYMVVNGNGYSGETSLLSHNASTDEIRVALEEISGIGTITVTDGPFLSIDRYKTGCPGRFINVQFDDVAGDQPMIHVESVWLSGDGVDVSVSEEVPGGMMSSPIPGHMLQTVERTPQVHVRVKGQLASCSGDHALYHEFDPDLEEDTDFCRFSYSPPSTPHILTVAPPTAESGDTVTITGTGFGHNPSLILVLFGDVACEVTTASDEEVTCVLDEGVAGLKKVFLQVVGGNGGIADIDDAVNPLEYIVVVETVLPWEGSQAGGTMITISGTGFARTSSDSGSTEWNHGNEILSDAYHRALAGDNGCSGGWENLVMVGEWECDIITSDHMTITCITPANQNAGSTNAYDVTVQVYCHGSDSTPMTDTLSSGYTYSDSLTPEVEEVTPSQGSVHGGNTITITGNGFSHDTSQISVMFGDSTCHVTSATPTTITFTSPAHSGGLVPVTVTVSGNGFATGTAEYEFVFSVNSLSHCSGSLLGGQLLDISGEGFGTDSTQLEVLLGNFPCNVNEISDTLIRCVTSPTATTHIIDNNATSMEYGLGYVWNPDEITVTVGDTVQWNWYGTSFTRQLSVQQVQVPGQGEYSGTGFRSESGTRGSFSHVFTEAGDYYYIAGGYGHIGFNGTVHVVPLTDIEVPLTITVNSLPIHLTSSVTCGEPPHPFLQYTFAVTQTPLVLDTFPRVFSYQNANLVTVKGLATSREHNLFTIGGKACLQSGMFSVNLVRPDYSGPAHSLIVYGDGEMEVECELGDVEPGVYWPTLHVAGKGRGLVTTSVTVVPTYGPAHSDNARGSLRGGTLLEISVRGLSRDDITKTRVDIGNTPCVVQNIVPEIERLFCLTGPAANDGYSSLVTALSPVGYWSLQSDHYDVDGGYVGSEGEAVFRGSGVIGDVGDASVRGDVVRREEGISGNAVTDQSVLFNESYLEIPFHSELANPAGFGMGLWLKLPAVDFENLMDYSPYPGSEWDTGSGQPGLGHFGSGQSDLGQFGSGQPGMGQFDSGQPGMGQFGSGRPGFGYFSSGQLLSGSGDFVWGSGEDDDSDVMQETVGPYRIVVDFASFVDGVAHGYVIIINPCGQLEYWLASGHSIDAFSVANEDCPLISSSDCYPSLPPLCSGVSVVNSDLTSIGNLPPGVWSVIRCDDCDIIGKWGFVSVGWAAESAGGVVDCANSDLCSGHQVFRFNQHHIDTMATTYAAPTNASLLIGGTDRLPVREEEEEEVLDDSLLNLALSSFVGHVDEVSVFRRPLTSQEASEHFEYGSTEKQKIWIRVEPVDGIGTGQDIDQVLEWNGAFEEVELVDWNGVSEGDIELDERKALLFSWTSVKGLWQVTKEIYESCDVANEPIREWSPPQAGGEVLVWMARGETHYFIDPVAGNCLSGARIKVKVGHVQIVWWTLGQTYEEITVSEGTGLLFKWSGPTYHNLVEMTSSQSTSPECVFVGSDAEALGKVVRAWQGPAVASGEIAVTGLSPGNHYFVCSVANHCQRGMRVNVTVTTDNNQQQDTSDAERSVDHVVVWKVQDYSPLAILHGDSLTFSWEAFHSLHQVDKETYETCDTAKEPLLILADPSVDTSVPLTDLQPGTYYFICSVAGHCDAGMKISVVVLPSNNQPTLLNPVVASCHGPTGCSFIYSTDDTPTITGIQPVAGGVGTEVMVSGYGLVPNGYSSVPTDDMTVWIGHALCNDITVVATELIDTVRCTVTDYEAGYHFVDVRNGRGLADVTGSPAIPGPHRNASEPQHQHSPYPHFHLRPLVTSVTPDTGSTVGGAMVTVLGSGFSPVAGRNQVLIGDRNCAISSSTYSEIKCVTSEDGEGVRSVRVIVNGFEASSSSTYEFSPSATPTISSVALETGVGGTEIVIAGTNFGTNTATVSVHILNGIGEWAYGSMESLCTVSAVTDSSISCSLPVKPAGSYLIAGHVTGRGLAQTSATIQYSLTINSLSPTQSGNGGGILVTITGGGFPVVTSSDDTETETEDPLSVWFCSTECRVSSSSLSHVTCVVETPSEGDVSSVCTSVRVTYNGMTTTAAQTFEFSNDLTPHVTSISPLIGGTAGGTVVTIHGSDFRPPGVTTDLVEDDVIVTIDGAVCVWYGLGFVPTDSVIECRTSQHRTTLLARVEIFIRTRGFAVPETADTLIWFQYIDRWSSPYTWGGEGLPKEGDSVVIKRGQVLFLDIDTPVLNLILVEGELVFDDQRDLHLQAKYIFINTGRLQVGTEESPFQHTARITLHGTVRDPEIPIYGAKVLGVRQGDLDLHGRRRLRTWTRLGQTARANTTTITLSQAVDWRQGDRIVIAATGKDGNETEENEIVSASSDGVTLTLSEKLRFEHLGITEHFEGGHSIELRAEVGLLSHNVIVEGSRRGTEGVGGLGEDQYGVQIMIHRIGPYSTPIRIEHTEVRFAGQAFRLGRYAIHFHLTGSMIGSYIRNCAIHHSNNRALTAHGVHDLLIEGNVAYDIRGHTFFVEDGIETNNSYIRNLGILTRGSSSLLNTDQIPATFWITNPKNTFVGNAAVASRGFGFWYDLDNFPSGASFTTSVHPNKEQFGQFRDNVAHTCNEFGLRIWETYTPSAPYNATLCNFTAYNNGIHGVEFSVIGRVVADGFKIADNVENGFEIQEANAEWGDAIIQNTLIVGHTSHNHGNPQQGGIKAPNKGRFIVSNVTFVNFDLEGSACLRACSQCKFREGGFQVWMKGLEFLNSPNKASFQWEHEVLFRDLDGSLTGHPGGGWVLPNSALLPPSLCSLSLPEFSVNPAVPGASCTSDVYFLRLAWNLVQPLDTFREISANVTNEFGRSVVPWRHYRRTHRDGYMCTLPASYPHTIQWDLPPEHEVDVTSYSAGVYNLRPTDHVTITHQFVEMPDHVDINGSYQPTQSGDLPQYGVDPHLSWHINNDTNTTTNVTYLISGESAGASPYVDLTYTYSYEPCPRDGCVISSPSSGPREVRRWSDNSSWTNGQLPRAGDDVNINSNWLMIVDLCPPPLGQVFVHGLLQFEDGQDYNFTADLILVHGPDSGMIIGTAEFPFQNRVTLTLTGNRGDRSLRLGGGLQLGTKSIGVFGNVSMHGKSRDVTWTRLSSSAMAGTTVITVATSTGWVVGDRLVIAPSGWGVEEGEIRTITAISGQDITIDVPLTYHHEIFNFLAPTDLLDDPVTPQWWNDDGTVAPEVGLLSHNIVVQGGTEEQADRHGCSLLVGRYRGGTTVYSGLLWLQSVEFRYCGQWGKFSPQDPRYSIAFRSSRETSVGSYVRDCAIHHGYNTAVGVHGSNGVTLSRNVVWRTVDSAFKIGGLDNEALDNLAIYTTAIRPNNPSDSHAIDFPASFDIDGGNVVRGNAAAGSTRIGFRLAGEPCQEDGHPPSSEQATIWGNTAHSGLIGLVILGLPSDCTALSGFTATHQWNYAIFSSTASSLAVSGVRVSVGKVGLNLNVFGPDPVRHFLGGKRVTVTDSIIIGSLPGQGCSSSQPDWVPRTPSISPSIPSLGVMMSSFNQRRSKMDGTGKWHLMKGYPVIDGVLQLTDVTFARFPANSADCHYGTFAIGNNRLSPDAVHPLVISSTTLLNCDTSSLVYFHDPDPTWINQEDCIDMDCDGPKHALIDDRDGTFVGTHPERGSVAPFAELRFSSYSHRVPESWLANTGPGLRATPSEVFEGRGEGVAKGHISDDCEWREDWNAYRCQSPDHRMLVIESLDGDTETRRLSPLALDGGDTGHGPYTDLLNGPMDHGWCTYYTCLKRLSTFFTIVATGTDYHIWMTGSNPSAIRFHLLNSGPEEAIRLNIWYKNPQRKDVYKDGVYIEATNTVYLERSAVHEVRGEEYIPPLSSFSGANFFDRHRQFMHLIVKGSAPVEIRTAPVVQVAVDLDVSLDDFFDPNDLISRLAFVLRIDPATIRVVKIVAEDSLPGRRRRRRQVGSGGGDLSSMTTITLEFGEPPLVNISQPLAPSVSQEIELAGETNDSVDIEDESESSNQTASANPLNVDPPQTLSQYIASLNTTVSDYIQQVEQYISLANETMAVNVIGEAVLNAILTDELGVENVTIVGVTVIPASPPPPPSPPVPPPLPLFENETSSEGGDNVTMVDLVTVLEEVLGVLEEAEVVAMENTPEPLASEGEGVEYAIPDRMLVTMEPREETGHLVHVKLTIFDASGEPVKNLGLISPWMCRARLIVNDRQSEYQHAQLEGVTAVPFVDGVAEFTRLRVDRNADRLTLSFTTVPMRFQTETSIQFSVVGLPVDVDRKQVSFLLSGMVSGPVNWGSEEVIGEVVREVGVALDVDISRIQNVTLQEIEWEGEKVVYVEFTLLGGHASDPPDAPSLQEAGETLQTLVDHGELTVNVGGVSLKAIPESFDITPSPPPTITTGTEGGVSDGDLVIRVAVGGASVAIAVSIAIMCVTCCIKCRHGNRVKKGKKKGALSGRSSLSQLPRLQPIFKVNPIADDGGDSSDDNIEVVPSFRPPSRLPLPYTPNLPSSPDLWDYDQDDDTDNSSLNNRSVDNSDCWTAPMYATPSYRVPPSSQGSKFSGQRTTLAMLANPPSCHQPQTASSTHKPQHVTYVNPAVTKGRGFRM